MNKKIYNKLSTEEKGVIVHKGTAAPFRGKYNDFFEKGSYHCNGAWGKHQERLLI